MAAWFSDRDASPATRRPEGFPAPIGRVFRSASFDDVAKKSSRSGGVAAQAIGVGVDERTLSQLLARESLLSGVARLVACDGLITLCSRWRQ